MRRLSSSAFVKTALAGVIATFVMTLTGFWQSGLGLPAVDVAGMLMGSMNAAHPDADPYGIVAGNVVHFANGVVLALVFVAFLYDRIPGNWVVRGLVYGVLTTLAAAVVVVPLAAGAGIFFRNTPMPGAMTLASTVIHLAYGLTLGLALEVAGLERVGAARRRSDDEWEAAA